MVYVHIPFCRSFCTYCDFYSEVAAKCREREEEQDRIFRQFSEAIGKEIDLRADEITDEDNTLYIGGGTPSVLPLYVYESLVSRLADVGISLPFKEFTFEVNPEDVVEKGVRYIRGLMQLGVNRFSMGIQSFDDSILKWMNRRHDSATAVHAYRILEEAGAENISIDLIFGLPQVDDMTWRETINKALNISPSGRLPSHISAYQLSVEPGSTLAIMVDKGIWSEASEELCARQYAVLCEQLRDAGYHHYEISNFALPGYEAKHNSAYWRHVPYVGLGPGAHSLLISRSPDIDTAQGYKRGPVVASYIRQWNRPDLKAYMGDIRKCREMEELTQEQVEMERIMLSLRTSEGIESDFLYSCCGADKVDRSIEGGNLLPTGCGRLHIPEHRFFISDNIISELV